MGIQLVGAKDGDWGQQDVLLDLVEGHASELKVGWNRGAGLNSESIFVLASWYVP